ncbi:MAG: Hsp70 family protein [Moraxellaceae bacterium]
MRQKIDYGIDLGTTNSAIARMQDGEVVIIKSTIGSMDTTPSCVSFNKKQSLFVGINAKDAIARDAELAFKRRTQQPINGYQEFKRTMGTDHRYLSSHMDCRYSSEQLSAQVLTKLRSYISDEGEDAKAVVITVPAMFKQNQIDATQRAAELAGIQYCELLQEPIAASIAYGIKGHLKTGHWLVFDFGGGTFDAALMRLDDGIMQVVDTDGDNHLGGKNIDTAIVDQLLIPALQQQYQLDTTLNHEKTKSLLQDALKRYAEQAKIELSSALFCKVDFHEGFGEDDDGEEIDPDIQISLAQYEQVCEPIFQRAIDICQAVLARNGLTGQDLDALILVGGPTFSQTLRRMLKQQVTAQVDTSIDPMTAVAKGAALFASTKSIPLDLQKRDLSKAQLTLRYPETTVETHENLGIRIDREKSSAALPAQLMVEVIRADRGWSSGRLALDGDAEIIEILLNQGKSNQFDIKLFGADGSVVACEPSSISIIHGMKIGNATLPYGICLDMYKTEREKRGVWQLDGLERNKTLPAKGKGTFKTSRDIRPHHATDRIDIQFYEVEDSNEGSRHILNNPLGGMTLTGAHVSEFLPEGSEIELTLSLDSSRRAKLSVYIPLLDETIEATWESSSQSGESSETLQQAVEEAVELAETLSAKQPTEVFPLAQELERLQGLLDSRASDFDARMEVHEGLKKVLISLDKLEDALRWPTLEAELDEELQRLVSLQQEYGDDMSDQKVTAFQHQVISVKFSQNEKAAKQVIDEMQTLKYKFLQQDIGFWIYLLNELEADFHQIAWSSRLEAKQVLADAKVMLANRPSKAQAEGAVRALWSLMPDDQQEKSKKNANVLRS